MSWSISIPATARAEFDAAVDAAVAASRDANPEATDETKEQQEAASDAVKAIVASGCIGEGWMMATLSGHSRPGHEAVEGSHSAPDTTGVYVTQVPAPVPA